MKLFTLGVNHETAPVDIREKVSFSAEQIPCALAELKRANILQEAAILSTCNRTEIYGVLNDADTQSIRQWLHVYFKLEPCTLNPYLYEHHNVEATKHMMKVACGLNSLVLGEPQILGQMKNAYSVGHKAETIHHTLEHLFQQIFKTAKQVRTDTAIGASPVSVAFSAVALSKQFYGDLSERTALLLGAGETIELVARHLKEGGVGKLIIANRTLSRAHKLAELLGGYAIGLNEIPNHLHEADIVIGSTGSPMPILTKEHVGQALKKRRNSPIFMVDIAVPRDIEAAAGDFSDAYLYSVDDLQEIIKESKRSRMTAAQAAEEIIDVQAEAFMTQYVSIKKVNPLIERFRTNAYHQRDLALKEALHHLQRGDSAELVLTKLANQLTNKILHIPSSQLHHAGIEGNETLIEAAKGLLLPPKP